MATKNIPATTQKIPTTSADPFAPASFKRKILFVVTGFSPAVVTESLYALAIHQDPAFVPTEMHVLSTGAGAAVLTKALLDETNGVFSRMVKEYPALADVKFNANHIPVIKDRSNRVIDDLTTLQENEDAADSIVDTVRKFTLDDHTALHVSLAGGRKTMGFFAGYALSLFARPQDRLSHVLVPNGVEKNREFYFPSSAGGDIVLDDGRTIKSKAVMVLLAEIPVVRLRAGLPQALTKGGASYRSIIEAADLSLGAPNLVIDGAAGKVDCSGKPVGMSRASLAFYWWAVTRKVTLTPESSAIETGQLRDEYRDIYDKTISGLGSNNGSSSRAGHGAGVTEDGSVQDGWLRERVTEVTSALKLALGPELSEKYRVKLRGRKKGYWLPDLQIENIKCAAIPAATSVKGAAGT